MPRTSRQHSDTGVYHVMLRGIDCQDIFADDQDRGKLHQKNRPYFHYFHYKDGIKHKTDNIKTIKKIEYNVTSQDKNQVIHTVIRK